MQLKAAVDACLKLSSKGKCSKGSHGPIETWDVSRVTDMRRMFAHARLFDIDLSKWDVSRVKSMNSMFLGATSFNRDLSKWDVSGVSDMQGMFLGATLFKRNLCGLAWVNSRATQTSMFEGTSGSISTTVCTQTTIFPIFSPESSAELKSAVEAYLELSAQDGDPHSLHGPIGDWDVSRVADMTRMFAYAKSFNEDISKWDVSHVTDMSAMFSSAVLFNGDISKWDVSRVRTMHGMFWDATSFDHDISKWDVSGVTAMGHMFASAESFNGDISKWDVSSVTDMRRMFMTAESFDGDISKWDVSRVLDMHGMFSGATQFKRSLCGTAWVDSKATKTIMFKGTSGSISAVECAQTTIAPVFSPRSGEELKGAVESVMSSNLCDNTPQEKMQDHNSEQTQGSNGGSDSGSEDPPTSAP